MRKADEEAFREFARGHAPVMQRSAYLLCGDWHAADDLVQTALLKMYRAWPRLSVDASPVQYARRILLNCWLDERRRPWRWRERRDGVVPDTALDDGDPAASLQARQVRDELSRALALVPPRQRAVLVLRYYESLSVAETAEALACSEGTVKSQTARGLAALKAAYTQAAALRETS